MPMNDLKSEATARPKTPANKTTRRIQKTVQKVISNQKTIQQDIWKKLSLRSKNQPPSPLSKTIMKYLKTKAITSQNRLLTPNNLTNLI